MSKYPRLPTLINRVIEINWLGEETSQFTYDPDPQVPSQYDQSKLFSAFRCTFKIDQISDGFYSIPIKSSISLPLNSNLLVTDWNLSYSKSLFLVINHAEVIPDTISYDSPTINIERNAAVSNTLRKYKYITLQKELREMDTSSECSDNNFLYLSNLQKNHEENLEEQEEKIEVEVSAIEEKANKVHIGFGTKSNEKAKNFGKKRVKNEEDELQDVMNLMQPVTTEDVLEMIGKEKSKGTSNIKISYDIGIDVFPNYALEYLKHKYNIV